VCVCVCATFTNRYLGLYYYVVFFFFILPLLPSTSVIVHTHTQQIHIELYNNINNNNNNNSKGNTITIIIIVTLQNNGPWRFLSYSVERSAETSLLIRFLHTLEMCFFYRCHCTIRWYAVIFPTLFVPPKSRNSVTTLPIANWYRNRIRFVTSDNYANIAITARPKTVRRSTVTKTK